MRRSRLVIVFAFLLLGGSLLSAAPHGDFDHVVDFSVTLKSLSAAAAGSGVLPTDRFVLLTGTVADVTFLDANEATFRVRVELITGEWVTSDEVRSYTCYVEFSGPEFFKIFPARAPRTVTPGIIVANTRVLVVGKPSRIVTNAAGVKEALVDGATIRSIE